MKHAILAAALTLPTAANAQAPAPASDPVQVYLLIQGLGNLLAAESLCGLSYDQQAVADYIDRTAPQGDLTFATQVEAHATIAEFGFDGMTESRKTALCRATENAARENGLLD